MTVDRELLSRGRRRARRLRADLTPQERRLWYALRQLPTDGSHFRRQVPIGPYVVDFACMAAHLVVEVDGGQHNEEPHRIRDAERTRRLESEGYRVLRFWNNEVSSNLEGVMASIYEALYGSLGAEPAHLKHQRVRREDPTPALRADPPPAGEGEGNATSSALGHSPHRGGNRNRA